MTMKATLGLEEGCRESAWCKKGAWCKITAERELNSGASWKRKLLNLAMFGYEGPRRGEVAVV